jgi:hypothetical protein
MPRTLPTALVEAVNAPTSNILILWLMTISHADVDTLRIVNNTEAVTSNGNTFLSFPFSVVYPPDDPESSPVFKITVANVAREVVSIARSIAGQRTLAKCKLELVEYADPDTILETHDNFDVRNISYNRDVLSFDAAPRLFFQKSFPKGRMLPSNFPGLF